MIVQITKVYNFDSKEDILINTDYITSVNPMADYKGSPRTQIIMTDRVYVMPYTITDVYKIITSNDEKND